MVDGSCSASFGLLIALAGKSVLGPLVFELSKVVGWLLAPLTFVLLCWAAALLWLWRSRFHPGVNAQLFGVMGLSVLASRTLPIRLQPAGKPVSRLTGGAGTKGGCDSSPGRCIGWRESTFPTQL